MKGKKPVTNAERASDVQGIDTAFSWSLTVKGGCARKDFREAQVNPSLATAIVKTGAEAFSRTLERAAARRW